MKKPSRYERERLLLKNKPRKVLNLEERVQAIRMYDRIPVYQRVASEFQCSWEQIKNVVLNRDSILKYYARCQNNDSDDGESSIRNKKINFLGNAVYEYIKRAHYYRSAKLDDNVIRERALEFRDIIQIYKFYPNKAWINDFKKLFKIDWHNLKRIAVADPPPHSLDSKEIIAYCRKNISNALTAGQEKKRFSASSSRKSLAVKGKNDFDATGDDNEESYFMNNHGEEDEPDETEDGDVMYFGGDNDVDDGNDVDDTDVINDDEEGLTINYGDYNDNDYNDYDDNSIDLSEKLLEASEITNNLSRENFDFIDTTVNTTTDAAASASDAAIMLTSESPVPLPKIIKVEGHSRNNSPSVFNINQPNSTPIVHHTSTTDHNNTQEITNYAEALKYLRPLAEFALVEEDFHAVNLLSQLADIYERGIEHKRRRTFSD